jgi:hypothetical protein
MPRLFVQPSGRTKPQQNPPERQGLSKPLILSSDRSERLQIEGTELDVFFCAETQREILGAFVSLFSRTRHDRKTGIVEVQLRTERGQAVWNIIQEPDKKTLEIIKRVYFDRHIIDRNNSRKALIPASSSSKSGRSKRKSSASS